MKRSDRAVIDNIICINGRLDRLQDKIEGEQEIVIKDVASPTLRLAERLIALDNRRIDLCNLNVLYGMIRRGLGERFDELKTCVRDGVDSPLYECAAEQMALVGYDIERARNEFSYLFDKKKRKSARIIPSAHGFSSAIAVSGATV